MRCPNRACRRLRPNNQPAKLVCVWSPKLKRMRWGCPACEQSMRSNHDHHVRTNKKIWHAYDVYGKDKTIEKNKQWGLDLQARAARMRRTAHRGNLIS